VEGWREFTTAETSPPELVPARQREELAEDDQLLYDEYRLDYHTRLAVVATSALQQVVHTGRRLTLLNRHAVSARRGLVLSGAAGTGKTTAITQFGKTHEAIDRHRHPGDGTRVPVIYVTVPPAATPRMLPAEFARFLGCRSSRGRTSPTSSRPSAASRSIPASAWSAWMRSTTCSSPPATAPRCPTP
jgi:hypothetical protein